MAVVLNLVRLSYMKIDCVDNNFEAKHLKYHHKCYSIGRANYTQSPKKIIRSWLCRLASIVTLKAEMNYERF